MYYTYNVSKNYSPYNLHYLHFGNMVYKYTTLHSTPPTLLTTSALIKKLTFSDQSSSLSKSRYYRIRQLCCICHNLNSTNACTTATSISHSKLDYCNSLYYNLPKSQTTVPNRCRTLLHVLLLKLLNHLIPLPCYVC